MSTPITLKLYKNEEEPLQFTRSFIPWGLLKEAVKLEKSLDLENISEESVDDLSGLIVSIFGDQFSNEDLENYADLGEMVEVIRQVLVKANAVGNSTSNPTRAG